MSFDPEKLDRVIERYLDGDAGEDEEAWLAARLGESSADLDSMVEALLVEAEMIHLAEEGDLCAVKTPGIEWWRRPFVVSLAAAAAVLVLAAVVLSRIVLPPAEPFASWTPSAGAVVSVVSGQGDAPDELSIGSSLRVSQGCAEVLLAEGVRCVVQAPASLKIEARGRVRLEDGAARFRVEEQARGFEVLTEELRVVDLGTEFGIDVRGEGRGEVHVMTGLVEVSALGGRRETMRVEAGGAVALAAAGQLEATLCRPELFVSELPGGIPALWFDFENPHANVHEGVGQIARREGVRMRTGRERGAKSGEGRRGKGLVFEDGRFAESNWPGIGGTNPRTIAFWIRLDPSDYERPFAILGWGRFNETSKMSDFGIRMSGGKGGVRIVSGRRWLEGRRTIADGEWHHVLVMVGSHRKGAWPETKLYIDGEEDVLMPGEPWQQPKAPLDTFFTDVHHDFSQPLLLGRFQAEGPQFLPELEASLDELVIAEGVLNSDQIRALYEGRMEETGLDLGR